MSGNISPRNSLRSSETQECKFCPLARKSMCSRRGHCSGWKTRFSGKRKIKRQIHTWQLAHLAKKTIWCWQGRFIFDFSIFMSAQRSKSSKRHVSLMKVFRANFDDRYTAALCLQQTEINPCDWGKNQIFFFLSSKKLAILNTTGKLKSKRNGGRSEGSK